jgi:hypothetical protein
LIDGVGQGLKLFQNLGADDTVLAREPAARRIKLARLRWGVVVESAVFDEGLAQRSA